MYGEARCSNRTEAFQVSGRVFGIPHPSFLCRVKRALPIASATMEMARGNGSTEKG